MNRHSNEPQPPMHADNPEQPAPPSAPETSRANAPDGAVNIAPQVGTVSTAAAPDPRAKPPSKIRVRWGKVWEWLRDVLWPSATALSEDERTQEEKTRAALVTGAHTRIDALKDASSFHVDTALAVAQAALDREDARRASVESRLSTVLGMTSIASALAIGMLTAFAANSQALLGPSIMPVAALVYLYSVVQLVCALRSAIRGVARNTYTTTSVAERLPARDETTDAYKKRRAKDLIAEADAQHAVDNVKVTAMAVAHTALRNFVGSVLVLSAIVVGALLVRGQPTGQHDEVVHRARSAQTPTGVLQGPRGDLGARGAVRAGVPHDPPEPHAAPARSAQDRPPPTSTSRTGSTSRPH